MRVPRPRRIRHLGAAALLAAALSCSMPAGRAAEKSNPADTGADTPSPAGTANTDKAATGTRTPRAADAAAKAEKNPRPARKGADLPVEGGVVVLPEMEVRASRLREIDRTIKRIERQIAREKKQMEKTTADAVLNSEALTRAATLFGGNSAEHRAMMSAVRVQSYEKELALLEALRMPQLPGDRELIEKEIEAQRAFRREMDNLAR